MRSMWNMERIFYIVVLVLEVFQILNRALYKAILSHVQMGVDFHGRPDAGVTDGFGEGCQIEVRIVLVLDVVMGHVGMAKSVDGNSMSQADFLADFSMSLAGTAADTTAEGKVGRSADILMLPADRIVLLFDNALGRLLLRTCIVQFCLPQFLSHSLINDFRLLVKLFAEHLQVHYSLLVQNNHPLTGLGFWGLGDFLTVYIDHILIDQNGFAVIIVVRPGQGQSFANT